MLRERWENERWQERGRGREREGERERVTVLLTMYFINDVFY